MTHAAFAHRCDKLVLREFQLADAPDVQRLHADPRVRALLPEEQPLHEPAWAQRFTACLAGFYRQHPGLGVWRCAVPRDGLEPFAGWFSLMPLQATPDTAGFGLSAADAELGSRLCPAYWGQGLSLSGGEVVLDHAFDGLGLRQVWGVCHPHNRSALHCLQLLGFTPRGEAPYEGQHAAYHAVDAATWRRVRTLSRRDRLRAARRPHPSPA